MLQVGGLADIKGRRLQAILDTLAAERGECSLEHLRALPPADAKAELERFKGVGKKTAACVLLFALQARRARRAGMPRRGRATIGRPAGTLAAPDLVCRCLPGPQVDDFAVDTHVWEISKALGWCPSNATRDQAYEHLNALVPGGRGLVIRAGGFWQTASIGVNPAATRSPAPWAHILWPTPCTADDLKYDLHVLLVRHGKACPACAKAGSAKQRSAAKAGGAGALCPLADLKVPPSKLRAAVAAGSKPRKPRSGAKGIKVEGEEDAQPLGDAAAAAGGSSKRQKMAAAVKVEVKQES